MTIRAHLLLLAAFAVLPVLVFAVLISIMLIDHQQRTFEQGAIERSRAMMSAVDADLRGSLSTLNALGASRALAADDLSGFHDSAVRVLATQPGWYNITLALPSGQKVLDLRALGAPLGRVFDWQSAEEVIKAQQPVVGNVSRETAEAPPVVALRVPVLRDGAVHYILTAHVKPESFESLIRVQALPQGWVSGVVDGNGNFVARIPAQPTGVPASAVFRAESARAKEGSYRGSTLEGFETLSVYRRSSLGNWTIGIGIPIDQVLAGAKTATWLLGLGTLAALATALGLAYVISKRIADPMTRLAAYARNIGEESPSTSAPQLKGVGEIEAVARALEQADKAVRERHLLDRREKDAIEAADRAKDEFIATLSHELRNPLAALTSAAAILSRNDLDSDVGREAREVIKRQIAHMSRMIEDLLDLSRVVAGKTHLKLERFDLAALVSGVVSAWRAEGRTARHSVTVELTPAWIYADRTRMEQVLANLLDNALKFTAPGRCIRVTLAPSGGSVLLNVEDDGQGIAPEMLDRVFDAFVQGYQWMSRDGGGLGLGLALVKRLVELQQGTVSVASAGLGKGATFSVRLPRIDVGVAEAGAPTSPLGTMCSEGRKRVLVIDDNDDARQSLTILLGMEGHETYEAANGALGAELARHVHPDIALIDIGLPDLSGYEVARRIRADLNGDVTLVAVTGYGQPEDQRRAFDAGFDAHLVKPITVEQLNETLFAIRPPAPLAASASD